MVQRLLLKRPLSAHIHRLVLLLLLAVNIYPLLWMILNSLKTEQELSMNPFGVARKPMWSNYIEAWKVAKLGPYLVNSITVTLASVVLTLLVGALAAFF